MKLDELRKRFEAPVDAEAAKMEGEAPLSESDYSEALKAASRCEVCGGRKKVSQGIRGPDRVFLIAPCEVCSRSGKTPPI